MKVNFTLELFGATITSSVDISEYDIESVSEEEKEDYIYEYIQNEINENVIIYRWRIRGDGSPLILCNLSKYYFINFI